MIGKMTRKIYRRSRICGDATRNKTF